jgi:NADH dehydrogenase
LDFKQSLWHSIFLFECVDSGVQFMSRRVVTVFGGSGFVGRHVVQRLAKQGAQVRVATRDTEAANYLKPMGEIGQITPVPVNFSNKESIVRALKGANQAINLIGILFQKKKSTFEKVHVETAHNIAQAATQVGVNALVHISALGASSHSDSLYARSKATGEEAVKRAFQEAVIVRPSAIFGQEDHFFNMFASLARFTPIMPVFGCQPTSKFKFFGLNTPFGIDFYGEGGTRMQPVFVADVANAIVKILEIKTNSHKLYELGGPKVYRFKEMMEMVLKESGRPRILIPCPFSAAKFAAWFLELLPKPPFTCDQLTFLKSDNVSSSNFPGFVELAIKPAAVEAVLPTYLRQYRPPARRHLREA